MPPGLLHEQFILPPPALQDVIQYVVLLSVEEGGGPVVRTLLPTFQVVLLINLGPPAYLWHEQPGLTPALPMTGIQVTAPLKRPLHYRLEAGTQLMAINFTLDGFYRLFHVPAEALTQVLTDPDELVAHWPFAQLWQQLAQLAGPTALMHALVAFCLPRLQAREGAQAELMAHLPLLATHRHLNPLKAMAAATHASERTLQQRFQKYLGFSVKEATRFLRFRRLLGQLPAKPGAEPRPDWFQLLEQHGYYDQSHLIHDFAHFLQQSPTQVSWQLLQGDAICFTRSELLNFTPA